MSDEKNPFLGPDGKPHWQEFGGGTFQPDAAVRTRKSLLKLRGVMQQVLAGEEKRLALLKEQLHRNKHGGGA